MSKETEFRYFDAAATMPGGRRRAEQTSSGDVDEQVGLSGVVVKVAAGAGDKCLSPVRSQPKRRQTICNDADGEDTLDVRSVQWTSPAISVSQLATSYQAHCPLLAKVTDHCADFARGQVYLVHSCGSERRVEAELTLDSSDVTLTEMKVKQKVKVSIPVDYAMDVYVSPQDNAMPVGENWRFSKLTQIKRLPLTVRVRAVDQQDAAVDLTGHKLRLIAINSTAFLRANAISNGWVEPGEVTVIPEFVDVHLSVAVGMQDATDQEWDDYMSMFALAVRHVHYYQISCCPEVFIDSPGGVLTARRPSEGDDVTLMTSPSVSNVRRTCSHYETSLPRVDESSAMNDDSSVIQRIQLSVQEDDEERSAEKVDDKLAQCVEAEFVDDTSSSLLQDLLHHHQQQDEQTSVDEVFHVNDTKHNDTRSGVPTTTETSAQKNAAARPSVRPRPVPPRRSVSSGMVPADRPSPPVSRVKPIVRHINVQSSTDNSAQSDSKAPQLDHFSDKQQANHTSTPEVKSVAAAHAPSRGPVPVPARRHRSISTVADIPSNLETLSAADVAKCVTLLGLGQSQAEMMAKQGVDGRRLMNLSVNQLTDEFQFSPLDASKLARFSRGWRPT